MEDRPIKLAILKNREKNNKKMQKTLKKHMEQKQPKMSNIYVIDILEGRSRTGE